MHRLGTRNRPANTRHNAEGTRLLHSKYDCVTNKNSAPCMYGLRSSNFPIYKSSVNESKASEQTRKSHETKVFLRYPDNLFFRGQSFSNGNLQIRDRKHVKDFLPDIILEVIIDVKPPVRLANMANPNKIELIFHLSMICS